MAHDDKGKGPKADHAGQQKLHTIINLTTGETRQITQADWKLNRKLYQSQGFTRPDDDEIDETPETPDTP